MMRSNLSRSPNLEHPLTARFTKALALAANIHRLQARKGTQVPYMAHILAFRKRNARLEDPRLPRLLDELDRTVTALEHEVGVVGQWPPGSASVR